MKCQNCGENEANIYYTQIINGVKKEINVCEKCAKQLGLNQIEYSMPIDFSSFFGEFLSEDYESDILKNYIPKQTKCNKCGMTLEKFAEIGKFGCANCYEVFHNQIDQLLKNIYGTDTHVGRKSIANSNKEDKKVEFNSKQENNISKIEKLKQKLKQAIQVEDYEEAAVIRDKIKKLEEERE